MGLTEPYRLRAADSRRVLDEVRNGLAKWQHVAQAHGLSASDIKRRGVGIQA